MGRHSRVCTVGPRVGDQSSGYKPSGVMPNLSPGSRLIGAKCWTPPRARKRLELRRCIGAQHALLSNMPLAIQESSVLLGCVHESMQWPYSFSRQQPRIHGEHQKTIAKLIQFGPSYSAKKNILYVTAFNRRRSSSSGQIRPYAKKERPR